MVDCSWCFYRKVRLCMARIVAEKLNPIPQVRSVMDVWLAWPEPVPLEPIFRVFTSSYVTVCYDAMVVCVYRDSAKIGY